MNKESIPWVEKYRPDVFEDIILDDNNRELFKNILDRNYFPNLLLHGPPGIGKTTTIINLINKFKKKNNEESKTLVIHLNASDERGIDIIRNNIYNFVLTDNLFSKGTKFVILDEVDYMTRIAQQALKCLIQEYNKDIRYCLICNYISKIDYSLQYEFVKVRFNKLNEDDIFNYLNKINKKENINMNKNTIKTIIKSYDSDIRSMINYIQLNQNINNWNKHILNNSVYEELNELFKKNKGSTEIIGHFNKISVEYNQDKLYLIKGFINYFIRNNLEINCISGLLNKFELLIHNNKSSIENNLIYFINIMKCYYRQN